MSVTRQFQVQSSHGSIIGQDTGGKGLPLVLLHGNSASQSVFAGQLRSAAFRDYRLITLDLPGHGLSADAIDPARTYTLPGYADAVIEVLTSLGIERAVIMGWSLGGHVALEAMSRWSGVVGVALTGAPPARAGVEGLMEAFKPHPAFGLLSQLALDDEQIAFVAAALVDGAHTTALEQDIRRTDGRAREILFGSLVAGQAEDERVLVETRDVPVAVLDGENEPLASADYIDSVSFKALWRGAPVRIPGAAHAPFIENPDVFDAQLAAFHRDMDKRQAKRLAA